MLLAERARLAGEIARIDRILEQEGVGVPPTSNAGYPVPVAPHPVNILNKVQAIQKVLEAASIPLTPREIVIEVQKAGYVFESRNPANTLNPYLYGRRKLDFLKKFGRGFILAQREREFEERLGKQGDSNDAPTTEEPRG